MNSTLKSLFTNVAPLILLNERRTISRGRSKWTGNNSNWGGAVAAASGYDIENIFDRVQTAARAVRDGEALWERDSTCFYHKEFNWQALACLMAVAVRSGGKLHVLDFGGALGSIYIQRRKLLAALPECSWSVVEQPHVIACGKAEFASGALPFFDSVDQCFSDRNINVVLFSSVLQYLENPYELLDDIVARHPHAVVIDRTPFSRHGERITVRHVPKVIYAASYACRFLGKRRIETIPTRGGTLTPWFDNPVEPPNCQGVTAMMNNKTRLP